ncbi:amino acid adenylation domain-containing protein [Nocardia iowensis]|uniref:amino acid adenylation domain-containing protein n=1 Tax=Nocardia iowensis TaxID=204891 RepID=UPI001FE3A5E8|nr:amino acid adenylation domain-containing protein [Nocardia iowensis]
MLTGADDAVPREAMSLERTDATAQSMYPLSTAQLRWWVAQQLQPAVPITVAMYLDLSGPLDVGLMLRCARRAARELQSPHLRFRVVDGYPRQYVDTAAELPIRLADLTNHADPIAAAQEQMERDYSSPLDPLTDDLTVATVFQVAPDHHLLYLRSHHIVLDGVGAAAVLRRTGELYRSEVLAGHGLSATNGHPSGGNGSGPSAGGGTPGRVAPESGSGHRRATARVLWRSASQVGDSESCGMPAGSTRTITDVGGPVNNAVAEPNSVPTARVAPPKEVRPLTVPELLDEERKYQDSARASTDRDYWRDQLATLGEPIGLAGRPAAPEPRPHRVTATMDAATAELLAAARARHGATFPELAITAFACYLARMTGSAEVTLTMPVTARPTAALRRSAGSMSNVVPLRLTGLDTGTVGGVIAQVRSTVIGALRHQRYRYEDMQRDRGQHHVVRGGFGPVVNVLGFTEPFGLGSLTGQVRLLSLGPVEDLLVNGYQAGPDERSISIDFHANPARYRYDLVAWQHRVFLDYFAHFLAAESDCPIPALDLALPAPMAADPAGPVRVLPDLLRAGLVPDAVAVQDGARTMTYRELDDTSSKWARQLMAGGARPGEFVAIAIPRSLESVLALWAVAKSGACFVPVDPADPADRIATVIADSGARQGITVVAVRDGLPCDTGYAARQDGDTDESVGGCGTHWLVLDDPRAIAETERLAGTPIADDERPRSLRPDHPAYLIYTSGTTGTPKGVLVTHRGLGSLTDYITEHYGVGRDSVVLHAHAPSFDAHLLELLACFAAGARLAVEPPSVIAGGALARLIADSGGTHFLTTPAVLATLSPTDLPGLRAVVVGGETCPAELVREWAPHVRLFNGYGPTETTVMATQTGPMTPGEPVTIGAALPGVLAVVFDSRLTRVPPGARGELYLGGIGVADGYLRNPAGTAVRFVADPFGIGQRLYRTGDLVSAGPDGAFEFLGRVDGQVEVRGRRIEPAEIETALLAGPEIAHAVVTVADAGRPEARLVGYVVAAEGSPFDSAATVRRLRDTLPAALVPSALIELDRLPVSGNGKVDRAALPTPVATPRPYRAPETTTQRLVAEHMGRATGQHRVGLDDDFFEIGGNSLLGVAVSAELAAATEVPVTVRWLYTTPTVEALADRITGYDGVDAASDDALGVLLTLRGKGTRPPLFCVHSAVPLAWCYAGLARYVTDRPVYGLQAPTLTGPVRAISTIDELADSYVDAMLRVQPEGPYHLLGWSLGGQIAHAIAVRLRDRGASVAALAMLDSVVFPDGADPPPVPRMRDLLTHLLGDEPADADAAPELTAAEAAAELARAGASFGTGLSETQLERLHRGYVDGVALSHGYRPGVFDGDLLYFSATRGPTELFGADIWRPFVTGDLIEHPVEATHAQLTNAAVVEVIGPILARHLERVAVPVAARSAP